MAVAWILFAHEPSIGAGFGEKSYALSSQLLSVTQLIPPKILLKCIYLVETYE
ncbi:hypothetical protein AAFM79_22870 [Trichormus azollae HNT15244]